MRFETVKIRGLGPFTSVDLDLAAIPGLLVAVTGANGAGKSTLLEMMGGALYRKTPTRGTLGALATTRDAMLEVRAVNGATHTIRHLLDAVSSKGESVVMDEHGRPLTDAGQRKEYDAFAAAHFPAADVLYASTFVPQGSGGFLDASPTERKRVLLRVLGIEHLEALAAKARERAAAAKVAVDMAAQRIAEARRNALPLDEARAALVDAEASWNQADHASAAAYRDVLQAKEGAEAFDRATEARRSILATVAKLERELDAARDREAVAAAKASRQAEIEEARARIAEAELRLERELAAEAEARKACDAIDAELRDVQHARAQRTILDDRIAALDMDLAAARRGLAELAPVIHRADAIREAQRKAADLDAQVTAAREVYDARRAEEAEAKAALALAESAVGSAKERAREIGRVLERLEARLREEDRVRVAGEELAEHDAAVIEMRREMASIDEDLAHEQAAALTVKDDRIADLRMGLSWVADVKIETFAGEHARHAQKVLDEDADIAQRDAERPDRIAALRRRAGELRVEIETIERKSAEARRLAARADEMATARADWSRSSSEQAAANEALAAAQVALSAAEKALWDASDATKLALENGKRLKAELTAARDVAAGAEALATAEAQREAFEERIVRITAEQARDRDALAALPVLNATAIELRARDAAFVRESASGDVAKTTVLLRNDRATVAGADEVARAAADRDAARRDIERLSGDLAAQGEALAALPRLTERPDVEQARQSEDRARNAASAAADGLSRARVALEASEAAEARAAELLEEQHAHQEELTDWTRLGQDLGKDGLQALEIDAAGPELTAIANDLLHTCVSRRWTIAIHTQRLDSTGKKMLEGCEVEITDVEAGRIGAAETFSGGERVLIGEAVSLALSVLACRRAGIEGPTLIRDESGAALDAANGRAYIEMLRRAATLIGAAQVLFVSHSPELQELADARIHVEGGTATVIA